MIPFVLAFGAFVLFVCCRMILGIIFAIAQSVLDPTDGGDADA